MVHSAYLMQICTHLDTYDCLPETLYATLQAVELGGLLKLVLRKMSVQLNNPPFNFMVQTSPFGNNASQLPYSHWFMQIVPQLSVIAGFEMGTGCYINPVFPEDAAKVLREVKVSPLE